VFATIAGLLSVVVCIALNAFFVAAEFALVTVRYTWVEEVSRSGSTAAVYVKRATTKLDDAIAATQLGITIASIALGWLGEPAIARLIQPTLQGLIPWHGAAAHTIATVLAFSAITFLHVVLGELAPKAVALGQPEVVAMKTARPLLMFNSAFRPIIYSMNAVGNWVVRRLGFSPGSEHDRSHSVGELKMLVEETQGAGSLDPTSAEVVARALELTSHRVRDVMVPRERVATLDLGMSERELVDTMWKTQYTRMPVFSSKRGKFIGVANVKLLLLQYARTGRIRLRDAIYLPLTLHHTAPLPRALRVFRRRKQHLAFVVDDDGQQIGVVTLEDVIEEMVGEIEDELDALDGTPDSQRMSRASIERAERPSLAPERLSSGGNR
jgi:putative hemolysin